MVALQEIAQKIVYNLQSATGKDVALADAYGCPLAETSGDLQKQLGIWWQQAQGSRSADSVCEIGPAYKALFQEIVIQDTPVCYLAVRGEDVSELQALSRMVRWLTCALVEQYMSQPNAMSEQDLRRVYFESLLFAEQSSREIRIKAGTANINPEESCRVAVLKLWYDLLDDADAPSYHALQKRIASQLEDFCAKNARIHSLQVHQKYILISGDVRLLKTGITYAASSIPKAQDKHFQIHAGISLPSRNHYNLRMCYENADIICERLTTETNGILLQEECLPELLLEQIPTDVKREFVRQIFQGCSEADVEEWDEIVRVLTNNNGSINRSAAELFMHKNTLQYRLTRIKERIGLDPRISNDAFLLQIAFMARRSVNNSTHQE